MAHYVLTSAHAKPSKIALQVLGDGDTRLSYGELTTAVQKQAAQISSQTTLGAHVLLRLGNTPSFPIAYLAAIAAGRVPIVTSSKLTPSEVDAIAAETNPSLTIADPGLPIPANVPLLKPCDDAVISDFDMNDPERPAYIVYTSGTSGKPRAVVHAHRAVWARRSMVTGWYDLKETDRVLHAGAFNWTYTLGTGLIDPWTNGATALIPSEGTEARALPALMAKSIATIFAASPGVYRRLLRSQIPPLPKLRHGLSAGEKLPDVTREKWIKATGTQIHEAYGMSECSTFISGSALRPAPTGTLGHPQEGRQISLIADGQEADHGVIAIHKSDPGLMLGYLDQPEETAARFDKGWFLTGDIGHREESGAICYEGRADDMMNAGGHRVSPIEVENALSDCAQIFEAACAEVHLKADLSLIAAFYTAPDMIDEAEVLAFLATRLADYKLPRLFVRVDALPRGNNNKLLRHKLRHDWEAQNGQT